METDKKYKLPKEWRWVTLEDIGIIYSGGTPSTKEPEFWEGDISWITPADLSNYTEIYISRGKRNISKLGLDYSSATLLPKDTILFSSRAPIGYVAIAKNELATNQGFKNLLLPSSFNHKFVYYYLRTVKELAEKISSGTTFLELSASNFKKIPIPLVPTEEQDRIVEKIEELFSELDYVKTNLETALRNIENLFLKTLKNLFTIDENKFTKYKLSDVATWGTGGTPSRKINSYFNGNIPWVKTQELKQKYINETEESLTISGLENSSARIYPKGSVVMAMYGATIGQLSILNIEASTNQACAVGVVDEEKMCNEYLYYFLLNERSNIINKAQGGAQQNISLSIIKEYDIYLPNIEVQKDIVEKIENLSQELEVQSNSVSNELHKLLVTYQKILKEAFHGKLSQRSPMDTSIKKMLEDIREAKELYINSDHIRHKKSKSTRIKINLLEYVQHNFKDQSFSYSEIFGSVRMSNDKFDLEFDGLVSKKIIVKYFDEESGILKYKLA